MLYACPVQQAAQIASNAHHHKTEQILHPACVILIILLQDNNVSRFKLLNRGIYYIDQMEIQHFQVGVFSLPGHIQVTVPTTIY